MRTSPTSRVSVSVAFARARLALHGFAAAVRAGGGPVGGDRAGRLSRKVLGDVEHCTPVQLQKRGVDAGSASILAGAAGTRQAEERQHLGGHFFGGAMILVEQLSCSHLSARGDYLEIGGPVDRGVN